MYQKVTIHNFLPGGWRNWYYSSIPEWKKKAVCLVSHFLEQIWSPALHLIHSVALTCIDWEVWCLDPVVVKERNMDWQSFVLFMLNNAYYWIMRKLLWKNPVGGKKKCFLLRGWVFYNSPYLSMGGKSCVLWHEAPYLVLVHQLTWDSTWSYCLVDLDWTLAITSLPGGYCSIGTGYPEKLKDLHPWRLLSLGEAEPKLIWPVGDPALSRSWDWMTSRAPFESMFLCFCSFLNKKI